MKTRALILVMLALLVGCATTPSERIAQHREEFARLPAEVQQAVRVGRVEVGFPEMAVLIAVGEPTRRFERREASGVTEVWAYAQRGPTFGFGFGVSGGGRHSSVGVGVDATLPRRGGGDDEALRVEFKDGKVVRVDYRKG